MTHRNFESRSRADHGKPRIFMPTLDFVGSYRAKCDAIADNDYEGFTFDATRK